MVSDSFSKPRQSWPKKAVTLLTWVAFFLLSLEILCWIFPLKERGDHTSDYKEKIDEILYRTLTRTGHPYFGNVYRSDEKVNNMGFSESVNFPYEPDDDEFIVGIFGGSLAHDFAKDVSTELASLLKEKNPSLKDKRVRVLNMAVHGFKQPQQFFVSSYFRPFVHLTINIDGFNELKEIDWDYPIEYPSNAGYFLVSSQERASRVYYSGKIYGLQKFISKVPLAVPLMSYSQGYYLFWSALDKQLQGLVTSILENRKKESINRDPPIQNKLWVWNRFTQDQARLMKASAIPAYFFIQPNQYVPHSKVLTEEERKTAYEGEDVSIKVWYELLRDQSELLRKEGVNIFDASDVFKDVSETIYIDSCCHINKRGNEILARRIADQVKI